MDRKALRIQILVVTALWLVLSAVGARANAVRAFDRYGMLFAGVWAVMIATALYYAAMVIWPLYRRLLRHLHRRPH